MFTKILGGILFISGLIGLMISIGMLIEANQPEHFMAFIGLVLVSFSAIYYTATTNFGNKNNIADKIENENEALRKKIEQKKLIKELDELNKSEK